MRRQITDTLMMIRPASFHLNEQAAVNNYFMKGIEGATSNEIQTSALKEFDGFVEKLKNAGIIVYVFQDDTAEDTPDSIFPNNWVSFHDDGRVILYPMFAENRRRERKQRLFDSLAEDFEISDISSQLLHSEDQGKFLEATGSLIFDCKNRIAYAALSERAHPDLLSEFSELTGYKIISFTANQSVGEKRLPIYHTNVMMCIADKYAVICLDSIDSIDERMKVIDVLENSGKTIVEISEEQIERFAGNMLQVFNEEGKPHLVMSSAAYNSLEEDQKNQLTAFNEIIHSAIDTIEACGGGSARCMMAEVFLPKILKNQQNLA